MIDFSTYVFEAAKEDVDFAKAHEGLNIAAGGKCGWFKSADSCKNFLLGKGNGDERKIGISIAKKYFYNYGITQDEMIDVIKLAYKLAEQDPDTKSITWATAPFVFGAGQHIMAIRTTYEGKPLHSELRTKLRELAKSHEKESKKKYVDMECHSGFGGRSVRGLLLEKQIKEAIKDFINIASQNDKPEKLTIDDFKQRITNNKKDGASPWDEIDINAIYNIYKDEKGYLDEIIKDNKEGKMDLDKVIELTGTHNGRRNNKNEIIDKSTFTINTSDISEVLEASGQIIADITIRYKKNTLIYISVKMKDAQLSGITVTSCMEKNKDFEDCISTGKSFEEFSKTGGALIFKNFCELFKIFPEQLYNRFLNREVGKLDKSTGSLNMTDNNASRTLGILAHKLLGGNYWYVNPEESVFVPYPTNEQKQDTQKPEWTFVPREARNADRSIFIDGDILIGDKSIRTSFVFRTDSREQTYPNRLFISLKVKDVIEAYAK